MRNTLFSSLLTVFLIIIITVTIVTSLFTTFAIRNDIIQSHLNYLLSQARDIAYLSNELQMNPTLRQTAAYLNWKVNEVYDEYGAYVLLLDSSGQLSDNFSQFSKENKNTLSTLDTDIISDLLNDILRGKEVQTRVMDQAKSAVFTVAVPFLKNDKIYGAVVIHTRAQAVEAFHHSLLLQNILTFFIASTVAILLAAYYTKSIVYPLTQITHAAENMSRGKLNTRSHVTGVAEVKQLAGAFNIMAEKLELVEQNRRDFVANVSHELRSPVTSIHGFVGGMLDGTILEKDYQQYLRIVFDETNRMKRLISDLLELSRMDKGGLQLKIQTFDINELIRRMMIGYLPTLEKRNISLNLEFSESPNMVCADNDRISQVITNIVDNALKYLSDNGNITITTKSTQELSVIEIINDGDSISPSDRPYIFERFYKAEKAHTSGQGTGLGLSICKQILQMHNQDIIVLPLEKGAGFRFTLQRATKAPPLMIKGA